MIPIQNITGRLGNQMFQYAYIYSQYRDGLIPDVYLQDEKYFEKYKDEIRALYRNGVHGTLPYVAIHVRRGDYVGNDFYVDLFEDGYYERAMAEFPDAQFMVFSDDPEWCEKQAIFKNCAVALGNSEIDHLNLMISCEGHIIANSSYSWWGAWLATPGHKTIAPKKWFTDGAKRINLPNSWILL